VKKAWILIIAIGVISVISTPGFPQTWFENGEAAPSNKWRQSNGEFGVMQLLSDDPHAFLESWDKPTAGVLMQTTNQISRGNPIVSFVLFSGCKKDQHNKCNLTITFMVKAPSGKPYSHSDIMEMWVNKPAPAQGVLQLSVNYMGVIIEPEDELGEYTVHAEITDHNSGHKLLTTQQFIAVE